MSVVVPVRAFAISAFNAAEFFKEAPCDIFDSEKNSRARFVAIEAMRVMFANADATAIANNLGFVGRLTALKIRMKCVRCAKWWNDELVEIVIRDLERALGVSRYGRSYFDREPVDEPTIAIKEAAADDGQSRRFFVPRAALRRPPSNVTGYLLGDPGFRSARVVNDERSAAR
jgi:hypothetical protein